MGTLITTPRWRDRVYQVEYDTPVKGGTPEYRNDEVVGGFANAGFKDIAERTEHLKGLVEDQERRLSDLETNSLADEQTLQDHIGSLGSHTTATPISDGFLSATDKTVIDNLSDVAITNDYRVLEYKPSVQYTLRSTSFDADVKTRYYALQDLTATLPDPRLASTLNNGDWITVNKVPGSTVLLKIDAPFNLLKYSEQLQQSAYWDSDGVTITTDVAVAPDGETTADRLDETSTNSKHFIQQTFTAVENTIYTFSGYVSVLAGTRYFEICNGTAGVSAVFDLSTSAVHNTEGALLDSGLTQEANGFVRPYITYQSPVGGVQNIEFRLNESGTPFEGEPYLDFYSAEDLLDQITNTFLVQSLGV